ncbi:MAG: 2-hydroxyglutaryl-CoA dehydratase [Hadesarchaea archaeon]|nr:MAG: 2-hydroxyglutaryl-CoA dehydratase [Hadesarchaea archaeon]
MLVAGCDVGSLTAKALLMENGRILSHELRRVKPRPELSAREVMEGALRKAGRRWEEVAYCVGTGYGRVRIPFANENISEISCHGKGAHWLLPSVRTVIDIGGQDCKVIRVDGEGRLVNFVMNDKCAAGTGRFLELMAKTLGVGVEDLGRLSLSSKEPIPITNICAVYAQSEVLSYLAEGANVEDVAAGVNQSMAARVKALASRVGVEREVVLSGGVAKNIGVVKYLEEMLGVPLIRLDFDPQLVGALGAALFASERVGGN